MAIKKEYREGYVKFRLNNLEVQWAHLLRPDTAFGGSKWCVEIILTDEYIEKYGKEGFTFKEKDGKTILKAKKNTQTAKCGEQSPPLVVGPDGRTPWTEDIGNGSVCNLNLSARAWKVGGKETISTYIESVQVVKHVAYESDSFEDLSGEEDIPF